MEKKTISMHLFGSMTIAEVIEAYEAATMAKAVSVSMDDNNIVSITFEFPEPEPEPEPEYECTEMCYVYGYNDEGVDMPCSHCRVRGFTDDY